MRDPNVITDEPRSWFKATEEWLDCHDALTASASRAAALDGVAESLHLKAGAEYAKGRDLMAQILMDEAKRIADLAKEAHAERAKRLHEEELIRVGYGPVDLPAGI